MQKKIGILGFGVVGKSTLNFLQNFKQEKKVLKLNQDCADLVSSSLGVWDQKTLEPQIDNDLRNQDVAFFDAAKLSMKDFIESYDYIIPSPGINLNDYYSYKHKFVCELDIFNTYFKNPVVAITGSLGKTTTTKLFGQLLAKVKPDRKLSRTENSTWFDTPAAHPECARSACIEGSAGTPDFALEELRRTGHHERCVFDSLISRNEIKPFVGGNIGLGMLEAIENQNLYDIGVLELSSFQLEFSKYFAPDLAVIMNCYPNHLDRHKSFQGYFDAKLNLLKFQNETQHALLSAHFLQDDMRDLLASHLPSLKSNICFACESAPDFEILNSLNKSSQKLKEEHVNERACLNERARPELVEGYERFGNNLKNYKYFYKQENKLVLFDSKTNQEVILFDLSVLPEVTFVQNWLLIIAGLYLLGADLPELQKFFAKNGQSFIVDDHHHRVEYIATINGVKFYDDSKATVIQSTIAAVKSLACKGQVILILGGLNKGVDRSPIIPELAKIKELKKVYCYGPACADFGSASCNFNSLDDILQDITKIMQPGDQVVLSPSGTSFDFYQNYKHRGDVFKELVLKLGAPK